MSHEGMEGREGTVPHESVHITSTVLSKEYYTYWEDYKYYLIFSFSINTLIMKILFLITPCSRVLLERLTGPQSVKKFPAFYGIRRFITAFTNARHMSLF